MVCGLYLQLWRGGYHVVKRGLLMKTKFRIILFLILLAISLSVLAQRGNKLAATSRGVRIDLSKEKPGRESEKFLGVVGNWSIVDDGGKRVLAVDGRKWLRGQPAGSSAIQRKRRQPGRPRS